MTWDEDQQPALEPIDNIRVTGLPTVAKILFVKQHLLLLNRIVLCLLERLRTLLQNLRAVQVNWLLNKTQG